MMKPLKPVTVDVDDLLSGNKYEVDEGNAHIELTGELASLPDEEFGKLIRICPAALYKQDEDGHRRFDYAGCLECGTCRIACEGTIVGKWVNPASLMGVAYRYG